MIKDDKNVGLLPRFWRLVILCTSVKFCSKTFIELTCSKDYHNVNHYVIHIRCISSREMTDKPHNSYCKNIKDKQKIIGKQIFVR